MKLLYLTNGKRDLGSTRYRSLQWIPFLIERGWKVEWIFSRHIRIRKFIKIIKMCYWADIVFIQKKLFVKPFLMIIKMISKRLIFDYDDALFTKDSFTLKIRSLGNGSAKSIRRLNAVLALSDLVVTGNEYLFEYTLQFNQNVRVVPTCIVYSDYDNKSTSDENQLSIGWLGSYHTQGYLVDIEEELRHISLQYPQVNMKVISNYPIELKGVKVDYLKWNIDNYKHYLYDFDIGIMPLRNDDWSKGKCAFKLIQYMAAGLPVIASNVGANKTLIEEAEDGYLVNSKEEWLNRLDNLINSKELRIKMGTAARRKIRKNYSVEAWIDRYESILLTNDG